MKKVHIKSNNLSNRIWKL